MVNIKTNILRCMVSKISKSVIMLIHLLSTLCSPERRWQKWSERKIRHRRGWSSPTSNAKFSPNWSQHFVTPFCMISHTWCPHQTTRFFMYFVPSFLGPTQETHDWGINTVKFISQIPLQSLNFQILTQTYCNCFGTCQSLKFWYFADRASQYIYLNINQLDALNFIMSLFHASTCLEHMCSLSGGQNCTIQRLVSSHL